MILVLLVLVFVSSGVGFLLYKWYVFPPLCEKIEVQQQDSVLIYDVPSSDFYQYLASKRDEACPEASRSYFEWYAFSIKLDQHFIETLLAVRGEDLGWSIAGVHVRDLDSLEFEIISIENGRSVDWSEDRPYVSMKTDGWKDREGTSYAKWIGDEISGRLEVLVNTPELVLEFTVKPHYPGFFSGHIGEDPAEKGSWYRYTSPVVMGEAKGTLKVIENDGSVSEYDFPEKGSLARAYMEHVWGHADINRFSWDYGVFNESGLERGLYFVQANKLGGGITGVSLVLEKDAVLDSWIHSPPEIYTRVFYSRSLPDDAGLYYPQQIYSWSFSRKDGGYSLFKGAVLNSKGDWLLASMSGKALGSLGEVRLDGNNKSWIDFYKGAMQSDYMPPSPSSPYTVHSNGKKTVTIKTSEHSPDGMEYWIFRHEKGRCEGGVPVAVLEAEAGETVSFEDGSDSLTETHYSVTPLRVPDNLIHRRIMAGRRKCSLDPKLMEFTQIKDKGNIVGEVLDTKSVGSAEKRELDDGSIVNLIERDDSVSCYMYLNSTEGFPYTLKPCLAPGVKVESMDALPISDNCLLLAWSEKVPLNESGDISESDVFLSANNMSTGRFEVIPVSMSSLDSTGASLIIQEDKLVVMWKECGEGDCVNVYSEFQLEELSGHCRY